MTSYRLKDYEIIVPASGCLAVQETDYDDVLLMTDLYSKTQGLQYSGGVFLADNYDNWLCTWRHRIAWSAIEAPLTREQIDRPHCEKRSRFLISYEGSGTK